MSDVAPEVADHAEVIRQADRRGGRVLVHGLGLGLVLRDLLSLPAVEHVDVVEVEPEVIALVAPTLDYPGRLTIHYGDCRTKWWPPDARWTIVWHDIWADTGRESAQDARELVARFADRCDWQACWGHEVEELVE